MFKCLFKTSQLGDDDDDDDDDHHLLEIQNADIEFFAKIFFDFGLEPKASA